MRTALVTGATGMLGSYIVEQLARDGWRVRALVRALDGERCAGLRALGAECVLGNLDDAASLRGAAEGTDVVFHAAAAVGQPGGWDVYRALNVEGTRRIVDAAAGAGARLVHISSTAVYSGSARYTLAPVDETAVPPPHPEHDFYGRSKFAGERIVIEASENGRVWASAVRPPPLYGCRDRQFVPRLAPVLQRGFFPLIGAGRSIISAVHAANVAHGAILAATTDAARGRVYNLTNDVDVSVAEFIRLAAEGLGRRVWTPTAPLSASVLVARVLAGALVLVGRGHLAPNARGAVDLFSRDNPFTSERARRELGWTPPVRPEVGIPEAFRWWKSHR